MVPARGGELVTSALAILPVMTPEVAIPCVRSIEEEGSAFDLPVSQVLIVDNSRDGWASKLLAPCPEATYEGFRIHRDPEGHNLGIARSWNVGAREVIERGLDYLLIVSASMLFGPTLQTTLMREFSTYDGAPVIEAMGHSWHLIAIHRSSLESVGLFDENFYPAYFEADDWCRRLELAHGPGEWPRFWLNAMCQGVALGIGESGASCPADPLMDYLAMKWGGPKHHETFTAPWGDRPLDYWPERSIPELAKDYGLEVWW